MYMTNIAIDILNLVRHSGHAAVLKIGAATGGGNGGDCGLPPRGKRR
jgi:hypothetical protein